MSHRWPSASVSSASLTGVICQTMDGGKLVMAGVSSETGSKAMVVQAIGEVAAIQAAPVTVKP